jgi:hypothetical protein
MRFVRAALALWVLLVVAANPARAHIVSDREVKLWRELPTELASRLGRDDRPDATGAAGANRGGFHTIEAQRPALLLLMDAAARGDSSAAEVAWSSIEYGFAHQTPSGDFTADAQDRARDSSLAHVTGAVRWTAELCRAEVVVLNGPLAERFRFRVALMLPKLRRTVDALAVRAPLLERLHRGRPDLQALDAEAFLLADGIYHEPSFSALGGAVLTEALRGQRPDGALAKHADPGAQALGLWSLLAIATYYPAPSLERAATRAAQWLEPRVAKLPAPRAGAAGPAGAVARDALLALAYRARYTADARAIERAAALAEPWLR